MPDGAVDAATAEEVSMCVVREYLSANGYKSALEALDRERVCARTHVHVQSEPTATLSMQRITAEIKTRSALVKCLRLERLYKKNKEREAPLGSVLEIVVDERGVGPPCSPNASTVAGTLHWVAVVMCPVGVL